MELRDEYYVELARVQNERDKLREENYQLRKRLRKLLVYINNEWFDLPERVESYVKLVEKELK